MTRKVSNSLEVRYLLQPARGLPSSRLLAIPKPNGCEANKLFASCRELRNVRNPCEIALYFPVEVHLTAFQQHFANPDFVARYVEKGPPAFMPGHAGVLQMASILLAERVPPDGVVLVVGAGGGLDTRALAEANAGWSFVGVDPAPKMLELTRVIVGDKVNARLKLIEGVVTDAPEGPFDAATLILVLGLIPDDGSKLLTLRETRRRLRPGSPFVIVDRCDDRDGSNFTRNVERYAAYARASGVEAEIVADAYESQKVNLGLVPPERNEALLAQAGFTDVEVFYVGMNWQGWVAYA